MSLVELGDISVDPNNESNLDGNLEWKGHFVIENNDWKSLPDKKVENFSIKSKDKNSLEYETVFSHFPSPKEESDRKLDSVQGYYLSDYGYLVLIPSFSSEQLLDGKAYEGAEGINWHWDGIIVLKVKSTGI